MTTAADVWEAHREDMFAVAYRVLGEVGEAEDVVQDAYERLRRVDVDGLERPAAWLRTTVSRLALNRLGEARRRRETYVGPWLPEPLLGGGGDPSDTVELQESVTAAFLVVLESLTPEQRVALILHDVFRTPFAEIAEVLGTTAEAARQHAHRARRAVAARRPRFSVDRAQRQQVAEAFLDACQGLDGGRLLALLAPDAELLSDGGGVRLAARRPVRGGERIARFLLRVLGAAADLAPMPAVHGLPGLALLEADGSVYGLLSLSVDDDGGVIAVDIQLHPDKVANGLRRAETGEPPGSGRGDDGDRAVVGAAQQPAAGPPREQRGDEDADHSQG